MLMTVEAAPPAVVRSAEELEPHAAAIDRLAGHAIDANPFYEPWFMMPLLKAFGGQQQLRLLLIYTASGNELLGFFPFEKTILHRRMPLPCLRLWRDPRHWVLRSTPLVRDGAVAACLAALLDWLGSGRHGPRLADLINLPAGSAFAEAFHARLHDDERLCHTRLERDSHIYVRQASADAYLAAILTGDKRRNLRRRERRIAALGPLSYVDVDEDERLIEDFLSLEGSGWKGRNGTAIASVEGGRAVCAAILTEARRRGRLSLLGLRVGGRLVAARSVLLAPPGGFGFKMAYDEDPEVARCSPSYLLELEGLRRMHSDTGLLGAGMRWLDTCADPDAELVRATRWQALPIHRYLTAPKNHPAEAALALLAWREGKG